MFKLFIFGLGVKDLIGNWDTMEDAKKAQTVLNSRMYEGFEVIIEETEQNEKY